MSKPDSKNIFEIMDQIMMQLSKTKRMFMIMVITILILPPIGLLLMTSVFDNPFYPDRKGYDLHTEWEKNSAQMRTFLLQVEQTPPDQRAEKLEQIMQSQEYQDASLRLKELAHQYPQFELDPPKKNSPPVKPLQLIIFVISGIWLGIGIRQWYIISKWDKKYKEFRRKEDDIDKKIDDEPEE